MGTDSVMTPPLDENDVACFLQCVGTGQLDAVCAMLALEPALLNAVGPHPFWGGRAQALHVAIETHRREVFDQLLQAGADVNGSNEEYLHWSPLLLTVHWEEPEMREELLRHGAKIHLAEALALADDTRVEAILAADPEAVRRPAPNNGSWLMFARTTGAIDRLLALGVPVDTQDRWGATPMEAFGRLGAAGQDLVKHLIARGIAASPAEYARMGDRAMLEKLVAEDPAVACSDAVLTGAVEFKHYALVRWLLESGANPNARTSGESKHTALHAAAWNGDLEMVKILIAAGADLNARDLQHNGTPLGWAEFAAEVTNNPACNTVAVHLRSLGARANQ
jgi:ankyrin repeat protein